MRKASHEGLTKSIVESFKTPQLNEAILLTAGLLAEPSTWDSHFRRTAASMVMSVIYDTPPIISEKDSSVKAVNDFVARLTRAALPGAHLVEFFPWMMYIPSRCGPFRMQQYIDVKLFINGLDLPNGSVTRSIGTRETRRCLRVCSIELTRSWSVTFIISLQVLLTRIPSQLKGIDRPSLVGTWIKDADKYGLSPRENSWLAATM